MFDKLDLIYANLYSLWSMEMLMRTVIIGNSGSGKSHLAKSLSTFHSLPIIHLDRIFWMPGGFNEKRSKDEVSCEVEQKRNDDLWIVEGVFGELAELFLPRTQTLIYLDMDWATCQKGLQSRGSESSRQVDAIAAEENFSKLHSWAEQYWTRTGLCSHAGHFRLFSGFTGLKLRFTNRAEVDEFLKQQKQKLNLTVFL
jgi:adenylate kinase family enzyme